MTKVERYAQLSVNEGIKRYREKLVTAVLSELTQLNDKNVFQPYKSTKLTTKGKKDALNLITMVKQKRNGKVKGKVCADGRKKKICQKG